jgi:D-alanine-D-alanine ligase
MKFLIVKDSIAEPQRARTVDAIFDALHTFAKVDVVIADKLAEAMHKDEIIFNLAIGQRHDFMQGKIAAISEMYGYEYVGSSSYTHYLCLDKFVAKNVLKSYGVRIPSGVLFDGKNFTGKVSALPVIIKPVAEGSGIGIDHESLCENAEEIEKIAINKFQKLKEPILVERFLDGPEVTVGVIGYGESTLVLPELEIDFSHLPDGIERYYSQRVKEDFCENVIYRCPSAFDKKVKARIHQTALKVFETLKARDYLRMDMRIVDGIPYVIEVNSMPGLDPQTSDLPKMIEPMNKDYEWLIKAIVKRAIDRIEG